MNITTPALQSTALTNNTHSTPSTTNNTQSENQTSINQINKTVTLSPEAKSLQSLDALYEEVDSIYESHLSAKDVKAIDKLYSQLDDIFSKQQPTQGEQAEADKLIEKLDTIFESAERSLTAEDQTRLSKLDTQIESIEELLFENDLNMLSPEMEEQLDTLADEQNSILLSQVSAKEKKQLNAINEQLQHLFSSMELGDADQKQVTRLFDTLDSIMNQAFNKLSDQDQQRVSDLDEQINGITDLLVDNPEQSMSAYNDLKL